MAPGGSDLQHPFDARLPFHIGQVGIAWRGAGRGGGHAAPSVAGLGRGFVRRGQKLLHHIQQVAGPEHFSIGHQRRFFGAALGQDQPRAHLLLAQHQAHGQCAAHRTQLARQRQLACKFVARQFARVNLATGRQDAQRYGQIQPTRIFGQVGRGQVDGDALVVRKIEPTVLQGRAHAFAGFFDLHIGQAHQREAGQAIGHVHFNGDGGRLQADQGAAVHQTETHNPSLPHAGAWCVFWHAVSACLSC